MDIAQKFQKYVPEVISTKNRTLVFPSEAYSTLKKITFEDGLPRLDNYLLFYVCLTEKAAGHLRDAIANEKSDSETKSRITPQEDRAYAKVYSLMAAKAILEFRERNKDHPEGHGREYEHILREKAREGNRVYGQALELREKANILVDGKAYEHEFMVAIINACKVSGIGVDLELTAERLGIQQFFNEGVRFLEPLLAKNGIFRIATDDQEGVNVVPIDRSHKVELAAAEVAALRRTDGGSQV